MEIKHYWMMLQRWAWLLALGVILGTLSGYGFSKRQTPVYLASTKMLVVRAPQSQNSDLAYLSNQELGTTFIQLLKTSQILEPASEKLSYTINPGQIKASLIDGTQLISLAVEDTSPEHAAEISNTLVDILIEENDNLQSSRYKSSEESLNAQVVQVQGQIAVLQEEISNLTTANVEEQIAKVEAKISELQSEIAQIEYDVSLIENRTNYYYSDGYNIAPPELTARLAQLKSTLELYQSIYSNLFILGKPTENGDTDRLSYLQNTLDLYQQMNIQLLGDLEKVRLAHLQNTPSIVQIEAATVPRGPIRPLPMKNTMLGAAVGLVLMGGIAFLIEYMDDTLQTSADVYQALGIPVLGYVAEMKEPDEKSQVFVTAYPASPVAEAFRKLRTSIDVSVENPPKTILVTSSQTGEGKTTIASNLAAIYSQNGKRVILVDADLRRPAIHSAFGISNRLGLSTLLRSPLKLERVWKHYGTGNNKKMRIVTCGHIPPNPAELLGSDNMLTIMSELRKNADVIIFDGPPIIVADVQVLASLMDGIVLVLRPGKSPRDEAVATLAQLNRSGASVMGVAFNRISKNGSKNYGAYGYYSENAYSYYAQNNKRNRSYVVARK